MTNNQSAPTAPERGMPTVSMRLKDGSIVELVYDESTATTKLAHFLDGAAALVESIPSPTSGALIPVSARNNLIRHGVLLLPERVEPFISVEVLLKDIEAYIRRYVDLSENFVAIASAYVLLSWVYDAFNELPYLRFRGDYGSGKTRALLVVGSLCYKPFFASGASTVSPIFHTLDTFGGTLIVDESDFRYSDEKAELVKIFNNGNVRGFPVLRSAATPQRTFNPRAFAVFGPKIVAMRNSFEDQALESRFLTEDMGKRPLRSDIPINLPDVQKEEARTLRNRLLDYRFRTLPKVAVDPAVYDERLSPRLNQVMAPLLSVVGSNAHRTHIRRSVETMERYLRADRSASPEGQVLDVVLTLIGKEERQFIPLSEITEAFVTRYGAEYVRPITARYIGHLLRTRLRLETYKRHGNYVLPMREREHVELLAERYGLKR